MSKAIIGLRIPKSEDNVFGYKIIENIPYDEPCVVCLGGDGSTNNKEANRSAKIIDNMLQERNLKVPVYAVTYEFEQNKAAKERRINYIKHRCETLTLKANDEKYLQNVSPDEVNPEYIEYLYKKLLAPRIADNGKRLETSTACQRIRNLNLVLNCHGGLVFTKMEEKMQKKMHELAILRKKKNKFNLSFWQLLPLRLAP